VLHAPAAIGAMSMKISEKYRAKALDCEKLGCAATEYDVKCEWSDIAIEWHSLANRAAQDSSLDQELGRSG
jgi:hypothetical protein